MGGVVPHWLIKGMIMGLEVRNTIFIGVSDLLGKQKAKSGEFMLKVDNVNRILSVE